MSLPRVGPVAANLRTILVKVSPSPVTLSERRAVLGALKKYAEVEVFKKLQEPSHFVSIVAQPQMADNLIANSPLQFDVAAQPQNQHNKPLLTTTPRGSQPTPQHPPPKPPRPSSSEIRSKPDYQPQNPHPRIPSLRPGGQNRGQLQAQTQAQTPNPDPDQALFLRGTLSRAPRLGRTPYRPGLDPPGAGRTGKEGGPGLARDDGVADGGSRARPGASGHVWHAPRLILTLSISSTVCRVHRGRRRGGLRKQPAAYFIPELSAWTSNYHGFCPIGRTGREPWLCLALQICAVMHVFEAEDRSPTRGNRPNDGMDGYSRITHILGLVEFFPAAEPSIQKGRTEDRNPPLQLDRMSRLGLWAVTGLRQHVRWLNSRIPRWKQGTAERREYPCFGMPSP
ncbi:predicted protein [Chaetomium globosum CBS 148.51]|uniref:Uncharacterized protein n=1 Tax=Chaetomium globosum (strain ATCC 6205 / CBS 148.51 / DSM 1962 / NBRC 6347 / NRRL 1970) TaxID=306901 RepID=Q2HGL6_CHAGB|nr:uncharacterized protein CHGG_00638 [Chaetomium globosum CBS 148.51]EAQ92403.1 predicted protein [Chaetomium globosum CBS 148.51]